MRRVTKCDLAGFYIAKVAIQPARASPLARYAPAVTIGCFVVEVENPRPGSVLSSILEPFRTYNAFKLLNNCFSLYDGTLQTASKWHLKLANFKFTLGELRRTNARFALGCPKWTAHQWKELDETRKTTIVPEQKSSIFMVQTYNTIVMSIDERSLGSPPLNTACRPPLATG